MFNFKKIFFVVIFILKSSLVYSAENTVFIDIDYVLNNSTLGKLIYKDLENINKKNITQLEEKEKLIKKKKDEINKTKNVTSKEKLDQDILLFNKEVEKYRIEKDELIKNFQQIKKTKLDDFMNKINPIIQKYMNENSIDIVLEKKQIFIGNINKDISNDIIKLIEKKFNGN